MDAHERPHIHTVVPGGGYVEAKKQWKSAPADYLVPVKVVMPRFRSIFLTKLKALRTSNSLILRNTGFDNDKSFQALIDKLFSKKWIIYIKESFKNSDSVIEYLSKYTHRIAISNYRIISCEDGIVSFKYRDYADDNKSKIMSLPVLKFIKRFLNHIVPKGFVRIRYNGLISNSTAKTKIAECREYFAVKEKKNIKKSVRDILLKKYGTDICLCKKCKKGEMKIIKTINSRSRDAPR